MRIYRPQVNPFSPPSYGRKSAVGILVAINVAVFILQAVVGDLAKTTWISYYFGLSREGIGAGYIWQLVTYMFLHAGVIHVLANMLMVFFAGRFVEGIIGTKRFLTLYFVSGILGGVAELMVSSGTIVGASAAGFALLVAFATIVPEMEITLLLFFVVPLRLKAKYVAYGAVIASLIFLVVPMGGNVAHLAHLVGCLVGWVYTRYLGYGSPLSVENRLRERREHLERQRKMNADEFVREEIDPILEKIAKEGFQSLSRQEKQILEKGRDKLAERKK